ncbi:MAG: 50S ribosomal protein L3 N(5)-glutamine methyltransferase [Gammaproteobacteria bacterium]
MEETEGLVTVTDFVRWGASRFVAAGLHYGHGTADPVDEALLLVAHGLHLPLPLPAEFHHARLTVSERPRIAALIERRVTERCPAAYLTGEAWFAGLSFVADGRALVPRSPIAELVEEGFAPWVEPAAVERVLDLCTGSGCIGIACAKYLPWCRVDLADISAEALSLARENIERHGLRERVRAVSSDVFAGLGGRRYDVIVSNPPYVAQAEYESLPREYAHEPGLGLLAGADGLEIVRRILSDARTHLRPGGILIVEVGSAEHALVEAFPDLPFTWLDFERGGSGVFLLNRDDLPGG